MKRPKTIWLLLLFLFLPSLGSGLKVLWQQSASDEFRLFGAAGIGMWLYLLGIASVMLDLVVIRYIWRPEPVGLRAGLASVGLNAMIVLLTAMVALENPDTLRAIVVEGHAKSGRSVAPELLEFSLSSTALLIGACVQLAFLAGCAWLLVWNRPYFEPGAGVGR
jgi:hypothetical protein